MTKGWPQYLMAVLLLLMTLGVTRQYDRAEAVPVRETFARFPLTLGTEWVGRELGIPQDIRDVLRADDILMREYRRDEQLAWLFIGFYQSQRTGATYHSPLNCLPGGGWAIIARGDMVIPTATRPLRVNRVLIQKGLDRQLVLYWYQDRGRIVTSEYWAKGYLVWDAMTRNRTDGALVRISVPVTGADEDAVTTAIGFLQEAVPLLDDYLPG